MNLCKDCTDIAFCVRERGVRINRYKVGFEGGAVRILDVIQSPGAQLSGSDAFLMNGFPRLLLQLEILLKFVRVGLHEVDGVSARSLVIPGVGGCRRREGT